MKTITAGDTGRYFKIHFAGNFFLAKVEMVDVKRKRLAFSLIGGKGLPGAGFYRVEHYDPTQRVDLYERENDAFTAWRAFLDVEKAAFKKRGDKWVFPTLPKCYTDTRVSKRERAIDAVLKTKRGRERLAKAMVKGLGWRRPQRR